MRRWASSVIALAILANGCAAVTYSIPQHDFFDFPGQVAPGFLQLRDGCVGLANDGTWTMLVWPRGWSASAVDGQLRDAQGDVVGSLGDHIWFSGGDALPRTAYRARIEQLGLPARCPADRYFMVAELSDGLE